MYTLLFLEKKKKKEKKTTWVEREIVGVLINGSDIPWYLFGYQIRRQTAMFDLLSAEEYSFFLISDWA
jgi:hypothetical protein